MLLLFCSGLFAQGADRLKIKAGGERGFAYKIYRYPNFVEAKVYFKSGAFGRSRMNFNLLLGEMHFIDARHDTLALSGLDKVDYIAIGADTFYYDALNAEFLEQVASFDDAQLMVSKQYKYTATHKNAAYGQYSATQASTSLNNIQADGRTVELSPDQYTHYIKSAKYYIKANGGDVVPATKGNFLKVFSAHKNAIQDYIKANKTDFEKEEDIKSLLSFSSAL